MKKFGATLLLIFCITLSLFAAPIENETIEKRALSDQQNRVIASKYFIKGLHYNNLERPDFAALFYEKAYQHDTTSTFLIFELSKLYAKQSQFLKSLETYNKAYAQLDSSTSTHEQFLGYLYQQNNLLDSAQAHYILSIKKDSSNVEALYQYSILLEETKNYQDLRKIYSLFIPQIHYPENYVERLALLNSIFTDTTANLILYGEAWDYTRNESYGFQLATLLSKNGEFEKSSAVLQELIELNPQNKNALYEMSRIHIENNDFINAAPFLYKLYSLDTTNIVYLQKLAQLEYEINSLDSALTHFTTVIHHEPHNDLAHYYMSSIYAVSNNTEQAIASIQKSIETKPTSLLYKNHLATLYYTNQDFETALSILDSLINDNPDRIRPIEYKISALKYRILTLTDSTDSEKDTDYYRREIITLLVALLKNDPLNTSLLFEIAASYERIKEYRECEKYFNNLIALDSSNHAALNYLGYTLVEQNIDLDRGLQLINKALELDPDNIAYLDSKIWYFYLKGDYQQSLKYIQMIPQDAVHDEIIFEHFAQVYRKLQKNQEEFESWTMVLKIAPDNKAALEYFKAYQNTNSETVQP